MQCNIQCGCANPTGILTKRKLVRYIGCQVQDYYFDEGSNKAITNGHFTVSKSGWYVGYISSHGADISETMIYYPQGTNTIANYYNAGDTINYTLGSNSKIQNKNGEWLEAGTVSGLKDGQETYKAKAVLQYLGQIREPALILTDKGFREGVTRFNSFLENTKFNNQPRVIEPQLSDVVYNNTGNQTFSFFSVTKFTVPESKNYLIGSSGDDYANVYIDGKPALWLAKNNSSRSILTQGNNAPSAWNTLLVNEVYLTAGEHTLVFWNCSPICCNISGIVAVKDPQTNEVYAYDTEYRYIRSELNCLNEISKSKFIFKSDNSYTQNTTEDKKPNTDNTSPTNTDTVEWVSKRREDIPCADVYYEVKKVNGVETSETRNNSPVTTKTSGGERLRENNHWSPVYTEYWVDGKMICKKQTSAVHYSSEGHNANDPDKSNNS